MGSDSDFIYSNLGSGPQKIMKLETIFNNDSIEMEYTIFYSDDGNTEILLKFQPQFWAREKGSEKSWAISFILKDHENDKEKEVVWCVEDFNLFISTLIHYQQLLNSEVTISKENNG